MDPQRVFILAKMTQRKKKKAKKWIVWKCWLLSFEGWRLLYLWPSSRGPMDKDIGEISY
jgi:hypothetical protein